jgi:membrane protease YdiL (CAAX protease family)
MSQPDANSTQQPIASRLHAIGLMALIAVWAYGGVISAANLHSRVGPPLVFYYLRAIVFDWLVVAYIVVGVRRRGGSLRDLIGGSWRRAGDFWRDVLVAFVFWIVSLACLAILRLALHAKSGVHAIRFLTPVSRSETILWILVALTAGFCEETIFRGYLQRQFIAWSGKPAIGILFSAALFGGVHAYQGAKQTILLGVFGAMFGVLAYKRQSLRPGMMAHAWQDALAGLVVRLLPK